MSSNFLVPPQLGHDPPPVPNPEPEPGPPFAEAPPPETSVTPTGSPWERYVSAILRHKWLILLITVLGAVGGILATRQVQLQYYAQSTLWIETGRQSEGDVAPIREGQLLQSSAWLELLRSFTVLDHVVKEQRLFITPELPGDAPALAGLDVTDELRAGQYLLSVDSAGAEYILTTEEGTTVERGRVGDPVGSAVGLSWSPTAEVLYPGRVLGFTVRTPRDVARGLADRIGAQMPENANFITVSLEGTEPRQIATTVNLITDRYVQVAAELKSSKIVELTEILNEQLQYAEQNLREAEISLENFRIQTITLPSEQASPVVGGVQMTRDPVFSSFFEMRVQLDRLRQDREDMARALREAETTPSALDALPRIAAAHGAAELQQALEQRTARRAELRTLQQRYTDDYAPVRELVEEIGRLEEQTIPALARSTIVRLASQEAEAQERINSASSELREIPSRTIEEARLERQVAIAEQLHATLKQRYEVARLAAAGSIPDIRVLDYAVAPSTPTSDPRPMLILAGLLGSLGLAVVGVLLVDRVDPRVRYPEQIANEMGIPVIGTVPHLKGTQGLADQVNASAVCESFRQLRMSVTHAHGAAGPVMFTITSAEAGDGKSFVSSNLALSFSQQGFRTLLIDGDIRRGRLHHLLERDRSPGLTDFLNGTARLEDILQETKLPRLTLVGSGTRMEIGPELLGSSLMGQLLRSLRGQFDAIVVDSPPLGAGVDPYVLGTITGNLMLVFRTGNTNRAFASTKLGLLDRLPIRVLGAVLNDVPANQRAYRYYSYLPGYAAENEVKLHSIVGYQEAVPDATSEEQGPRRAQS